MRQVVAIGHYLRTEVWIEANEALLGTLLADAHGLREAEIIAQMGGYRVIIRATDTNAVEMSG